MSHLLQQKTNFSLASEDMARLLKTRGRDDIAIIMGELCYRSILIRTKHCTLNDAEFKVKVRTSKKTEFITTHK